MLRPWIIIAFGRRLGALLRRRWTIRPWAVLLVQFVLGVYGGYFGGAIGIMMTAIWGLLDNCDLKHLNAPRTLLVSAANTMAVITFIVARVVHWPETVVMIVAAIIGGYGGAQIGRRAPSNLVRAGTLVLTACITLAFFVRAYGTHLPWR